MLPFTKRPGRGDESGDHDVVTKDDLAASETVNGVTSQKPKLGGGVRAKFSSLSDEEMTNIMPSKSIGDALESARVASPRPAAGMPPPASSVRGGRSVPSSKPSASNRSGKFAALDDEEEDGRTVVRGAPKIVKRTSAPISKSSLQPPTTVSPAAVIKATLDSARAGNLKKTGEHLMAPPPKDLLEDLADLAPKNGPGSENTKIFDITGASQKPPAMQQALGQAQMSHGSIPPGSARPMTNPPPGMIGQTTGASGGYPAQQSGGYPAQQSGDHPQYNGSVSASVPGVSMPAHFMVPQAPYSDARMDPPGTAVTARNRVSGRPATSWALALMAFGLFVGVGALAVMRGNNEGLMEMSASFVDPARAGAKAAGGAAPATGTQPTQPTIVGMPGAAVPTTAAPAVAVAPAVATTAAPGVVVAAAPAAASPAAVVAQPAQAPVAVAAAPTPAPKSTHTFRPRPAAPASEEQLVAVAPTPKPTRVKPPPAAGKPAGDPNVDEEQKKALKQLQESQLESTF